MHNISVAFLASNPFSVFFLRPAVYVTGNLYTVALRLSKNPSILEIDYNALKNRIEPTKSEFIRVNFFLKTCENITQA